LDDAKESIEDRLEDRDDGPENCCEGMEDGGDEVSKGLDEGRHFDLLRLGLLSDGVTCRWREIGYFSDFTMVSCEEFWSEESEALC